MGKPPMLPSFCSSGQPGGCRWAIWGRSALILALFAFAASGCSDARRALGLEKSPPDEFQVVSRAPLTLPPDYSLRPPQPGAPRPQERSVQDTARTAVTGIIAGGGSASSSAGEKALLTRAGTAQANPDIRELVGREAGELAAADETLVDRLIFWRKPQDRSPVVDAQKEAQRIRENQALGRPVSEGDTPTITRRKLGPLEGIF